MPYNREALMAELARDEGFRLQVYDDATGKPVKPGDTLKGHPTVGIGRALDTNGITEAEADFLLQNDILRVEMDLDRIAPWWRKLDDARSRVLISMCFNLGGGGLSGFKNMLTAAQAGAYKRAATEMLNSRWASQVGDRAQRLAKMMETGVA